MSIKTNAFVFATFLINCIVIGLLVASFVTEHWIVATAKRNTTSESHGDLHFGLFQGTKHLNSGVGVRTENIDGMMTRKMYQTIAATTTSNSPSLYSANGDAP